MMNRHFGYSVCTTNLHLPLYLVTDATSKRICYTNKYPLQGIWRDWLVGKDIENWLAGSAVDVNQMLSIVDHGK